VLWPLLGVGMIAGWAVAPLHPAALLVAQLMSGIFLTSLEGTIDARVAETVPEQVTAGMGWAGAVRALGSAAAVGAAPAMIGTVGLGAASALAGVGLACVALVGLIRIAVAQGIGPPAPLHAEAVASPAPTRR
jgi:hypothetical protein